MKLRRSVWSEGAAGGERSKRSEVGVACGEEGSVLDGGWKSKRSGEVCGLDWADSGDNERISLVSLVSLEDGGKIVGWLGCCESCCVNVRPRRSSLSLFADAIFDVLEFG